MACDVFAVRYELDPCDHVPGGRRRETMVGTVPRRSRRLRPWSRRGGRPCRSHVAVAGRAASVGRAARSGPRCRRGTTPGAGSLNTPSTAIRSLDGPARLGPVRMAGPFAAVRGCVGNGIRDTGHDRNRVPRGLARRRCGGAGCCGGYLWSLRSRSRRSADRGWPVCVAAAATHTRLPGLVGLVEARTGPMRPDRHVVPCGRRGPILDSRTVRMTLRRVES